MISQIREGATLPVFKTETIMNTLNPHWKPFVVPLQKLCNGDHDRPLMIECFDWNKRSAHEIIGRVQTTLRQLARPDWAKTLDLTPPEKSQRKGKKSAGTLAFGKVEIRKNPSFIEYLRGGCEINLICAIDFTASNGDPRMSTSLHYFNPMVPNAYIQAISAVGSILAFYDKDQLFPVSKKREGEKDGETVAKSSTRRNRNNAHITHTHTHHRYTASERGFHREKPATASH